jgi:hypothetical protein
MWVASGVSTTRNCLLRRRELAADAADSSVGEPVGEAEAGEVPRGHEAGDLGATVVAQCQHVDDRGGVVSDRGPTRRGTTTSRRR